VLDGVVIDDTELSTTSSPYGKRFYRGGDLVNGSLGDVPQASSEGVSLRRIVSSGVSGP
jgi:hypothetical protein